MTDRDVEVDSTDLYSGFIESLPERLQTQSEVLEGKFDPEKVKFLVYGESGVGKTVFASSWPNVAFLDLDKGMASIKKRVFRFNIDYWEDLMDAIDFLAHNPHPFKTIVLDSLNELQHLSLRHIVQAYSVRRPYDSLPSQSDYGKMLDDFDIVVRDIRGIPVNVVIIAQVAPRQYETDPVQPQLVGKHTARNIARMMDVVGYLDKKESSDPGSPKTRVMTFDATNFVTKDRSSALPNSVENPTYDLLHRFWTAG